MVPLPLEAVSTAAAAVPHICSTGLTGGALTTTLKGELLFFRSCT